MTDSGPLDILRRAFWRGVFPHQMTWILDLPGRGLIMPAKTVAERLPVGPDAEVLEVGPGSGYYSVAVARKVPHGRLTLLDVQPEMLEKSLRRLHAAGLENVRAQRFEGGRLPFDDDAFDAIFMVTVFGEIEDREPFLTELVRVLRPGGVLAVTEHHPDPDLEPAAVVAEALERHGLVCDAPLGWRWAYTLRGWKPRG